MTTVPDSQGMPDETFHKHLEARHLPAGDWAGLKTLRGGEQFHNQRKTYEMWHEHCHSNWEYDHDHV